MKISTESGSVSSVVGYEKAIEYIAKAGFDAFDFSMIDMVDYDRTSKRFLGGHTPLYSADYLKFVRNLKKIADDLGIVCNQSHAPFPTACREIRDFFKRSIECTAEIGGKICVIHPDNNKSPEENAEMYGEILPFAKEHGVKIATENMWNWDNDKNIACTAACSHHDNFLQHINAVNDDLFVACLDIGHAEMKGLNTSAVEMIKTLGKHIQALHIHDNNLINDSHQLPFSMSIDFEPIVRALKAVGYEGWFTLEAICFVEALNENNLSDGLKKAAKAARQLADIFEKA